MNNKEKILLLKFLKEYSNDLGNNTCNDVPDNFWKGWTKTERKQFVKEFHEWNGDPEEFDEKQLHLPDFALVDFLAHKLKNTF